MHTPANSKNKFKSKKKSHSFFKKSQAKTEVHKIRLNKFLANSGICSRREADKFIQAGVVTVNGIGITELGYKINVTDVVRFNNQKIKFETLRYILLNKPKHYLGRTDNKTKTPSVMNIVASACKEKVFPIDTLNKFETGVLLFTNDSSLTKKLKNKKQIIKSIYHISLNKKLNQQDLKKLKEGININRKIYNLDSISHIKNKEKNEIGVEHKQGGIKYIKEIFQHLNYRVTKLDRVYFGGLTKKNLQRKEFRSLTKEEINILKRI